MLADYAAQRFVVGAKQSAKAVRAGRAARVFLARDADPMLLAPVEALCRACGVPTECGETMAQLGVAAGIAVGAAVVCALREEEKI